MSRGVWGGGALRALVTGGAGVTGVRGGAGLVGGVSVAAVGVAAVGLAAALAVAGCSSSAGSSSSAASSTPSPSSASTSTPSYVTGGPPTSPAASPASASAASPTVSTPATSSPGGGGGTPGCATASLQATAGTAEGAAGSVYQVLDFTNISSAACTLFGYPGVALAAGTPPTQVGAAANRSTAAPASLVTLEPGQTANALLRITQALNYPTATCSPTPTTSLQIYPPNQTVPIYLAYSSTGCASTAVNLLTIGVMQPGSGSGQGTTG
jgi:hypothetical protein